MKIPRIPSPGINSGKAWCSGTNGKGSEPRNVGPNFRDEHERIFGRHKPTPGHTRIVTRNGKSVVYVNGVEQPS